MTELPKLDVAASSSSCVVSKFSMDAAVASSINGEATSSFEADTNKDGEDADVTIPFAFPRIIKGGGAPTAAEQIIYQFEVRNLCSRVPVCPCLDDDSAFSMTSS